MTIMDDVDRCDFDENWKLAEKYLPAAFTVLTQNASFLVNFEIASKDIDLKEVGDIVFSSNMGHIAFRVRRPDVPWRDFTLRSRVPWGRTEKHKIQQGLGKWYLYSWAAGDMPDGNGEFKDWILIDLDVFRECGLAADADNRFDQPNKDGRTYFVAYSDDELLLNNCIVARHNIRLKSIEDGWTDWMSLRLRHPQANFDPIEYKLIRPGDLCCYTTPTKQMKVGIIKQVHNGLIQIGATIWTPANPHQGTIKFFQINNNQ